MTWNEWRERREFWQWLAGVAFIGAILLAWLIPNQSDSGNARGLAFLAALLLLALSLFGIGVAVTKRPLGVLIDSRGKYSLSRLQIIAWSLVLLSAWGSAVLINISANEAAAADAIDGPADVGIPPELLVLTGISLTTLVAAGVVKRFNRQEKRLDVNVDAADPDSVTTEDASLADLVSQEAPGTTDKVDLGKFQALFFTAIVVIVYIVTVRDQFVESTGQISALPVLNDALIGIIALSHAGYVAKKAVPASGSDATEDDATTANDSTAGTTPAAGPAPTDVQG